MVNVPRLLALAASLAAPLLLADSWPDTSHLDQELPLPGLTALSDTGPSAQGLKLAEQDLIANGDFEQWSERRVEVNPGPPGGEPFFETWNLPDNWQYHTWAGKGINRETMLEKTHRHPIVTGFESTDAHSGQRSLNLGYPSMWFCTDLFPIEPGRKYVLSLWVKGRNIGRGVYLNPWPLNVLVRTYQDRDRNHLTGVRAFHRIVKFTPELTTFDWRPLRWQFTAPLDVRWATLHLAPLQDRGDVLFLVDQVSLRAVEREPDAWAFDAKAGFGNALRDNVAMGQDGLQLAKAQNLLANGGFEEDKDNDGLPDGWAFVKRPASVNLKDDGKPAAALDRRCRSGARALKLSAVSGTAAVVSPLIALEQPGWYTLSAWGRSLPRKDTAPYGYGVLTVRTPMDGVEWTAKTTQFGHGWMRESVTFPYPGAAYRGRIPPFPRDPGVEVELGFHGNGDFWFDDVQLEPARRAGPAAGGEAFVDEGYAVSEILDLGFAQEASIQWDATVPDGRRLGIWTRTGFTPYYDARTWTDWSPCAEPKGSAVVLQARGVALYGQWRATFQRDAPGIVSQQDMDKRHASVAEVGAWRYAFDTAGVGLKEGWEKPGFDDSAWASTADIKDKTPRLPQAPAGLRSVWFRCRVNLPQEAAGRRLVFRLEGGDALGLYTAASLYVNGEPAGTRTGKGSTWIRIEGLAKPGQENVLAWCVEGEGADGVDYLRNARIVSATDADPVAATTPLLRSVRVSVNGPRDRRLQHGDAQIALLRNGEIRPPLMPFRSRPPQAYDKDPKLSAIRTLAREITQGVADEDEQVLRIRKHIFTLGPYTGSPSAYDLKYPDNSPYDFLHLAVKDRLTIYCSHHWLSFTDLGTAIGLVVRPVTTHNIDHRSHWADNVIEYWSNKHNKWVLVNTFFDTVFTREGVPQSTADLMDAWWRDRWCEITPRAGGDISNTFRYSAERAIGPFGWWASPPHRRENSHGWITCVYVTDNPAHGPGVLLMRQDMEPHFIGQGPWTGCWPVTTDQRAVYAPINQTRLRLDFAGKTCRVEAENNMPNFSHYEVRLGDGAWQKAEAIPYAWALSPGANVLAARGVNKYGLAGPQSEVHARILEPFTEAETILPPKPAP